MDFMKPDRHKPEFALLELKSKIEEDLKQISIIISHPLSTIQRNDRPLQLDIFNSLFFLLSKTKTNSKNNYTNQVEVKILKIMLVTGSLRLKIMKIH